jgi:hypothetical protein
MTASETLGTKRTAWWRTQSPSNQSPLSYSLLFPDSVRTREGLDGVESIDSSWLMVRAGFLSKAERQALAARGPRTSTRCTFVHLTQPLLGAIGCQKDQCLMFDQY